jgi:hypothetical protein
MIEGPARLPGGALSPRATYSPLALRPRDQIRV